MWSIISGLLGIASSALPNVLGFFQQKNDQKHELAMAQMPVSYTHLTLPTNREV